MSLVSQQFQGLPETNTVEGLFNSAGYEADGIALALSGGGYKAAAYHLGGLIRLNELGYLPRIRRISSVSGGSITAAYLGLHWSKLQFENGIATNFTEIIIRPLHYFLTEVNLDIVDIFSGLLNPFRSEADALADGYDKHLFKGARLHDLPDPSTAPEFTLVATNFELNSLWRFSKTFAADYRVGRIDHPKFSLARIVAASSGFPPFFCPVKLDLAGQVLTKQGGEDRHEGRFLTGASLCDGGIYDNLGLEPIWKHFGVLLVSNAGNLIDEDERPSNWGSLMLRVIGLVHRQAENNRQRALMMLAELGQRKVAYFPLRNDGSNYPRPSAVRLEPAAIVSAQRESVRLWSLGAKAFANLANHGYSLCDSAIGSYLTSPANAKPPALPF